MSQQLHLPRRCEVAVQRHRSALVVGVQEVTRQQSKERANARHLSNQPTLETFLQGKKDKTVPRKKAPLKRAYVAPTGELLKGLLGLLCSRTMLIWESLRDSILWLETQLTSGARGRLRSAPAPAVLWMNGWLKKGC